MNTKSKRIYQLAEQIQITIARVLQADVSDPRLQQATIISVDLSADAKNAMVYFSLLNADSKNIHSVENAFKNASGFFRAQLSQLIELRYTPKLTFKFDVATITAERISKLLAVA